MSGGGEGGIRSRMDTIQGEGLESVRDPERAAAERRTVASRLDVIVLAGGAIVIAVGLLLLWFIL